MRHGGELFSRGALSCTRKPARGPAARSLCSYTSKRSPFLEGNFPAGFTFSLCEPGLKILGGKGGGFAIGEAPLYMSVEDAAPQPAAGCMYRDGEEERSIKSDEVTS